MISSALLSGILQAAVLTLIVVIGASLTGDSSVLEAPALLPDALLSSIPSAIGLGMGLLLCVVLLDVVASVVAARMSAEVLTRERTHAYESYARATWSSQANERDGHLQELVSQNAGWAGTAMNSASHAAITTCSLIALGVSAVVASPAIAVGLLVSFGLLLAASRPVATSVRRRTTTLSELNVDFVGLISRNVGLAHDVRTYDVEDQVGADVVEAVQTVSGQWKTIKLLNRVTPLIFRSAALLMMLGVLLFIEMTNVASLTAMGTVVILGIRSLAYAGAAQRSYQELQNAAPWLEQLWARTSELDNDPTHRGAIPLERIDELQFANAGFHYRTQVTEAPDDALEVEVLSCLDFSVRRGQSVGIVGPSGAGKSTLVKLLLRLHDPESGDLLANGVSAREFSMSDWYRRVGYVPQHVATFNGTVAENIAFFRSGFTRADIETAARSAHLHDEIMALPDGYDTPVGERLGRLSGGQRQRLALARALLGSPDILVLDEPTSALDPRSEQLVQQTIEELGGSVTLFIIAHRMSTLRACETIIVLENGTVSAIGAPDEVCASNEFFREANRLAKL